MHCQVQKTLPVASTLLTKVDLDAFVPFATGKSLISRDQSRTLYEACNGIFWNRTEGSECAKLYGVTFRAPSSLMDSISLIHAVFLIHAGEMEKVLSPLNLYNILGDCFHGSKPEEFREAVLRHAGASWPQPGSVSGPGLALNFRNLGGILKPLSLVGSVDYP